MAAGREHTMLHSDPADAFSAFYRKHIQFVYAIALSFMKNRQDAEDIAEDVFLQLLESGQTFPDDTQARAWLTVAVRNRCRNHLKNWLRSRRAEPEEMEQIPAPEQSAELKEVMNAILRLPERYRLPLLLYAVEGYSVKETAAILHINESTVRTRVQRARAIIKKETEVDDA